MFHIPEQKSNVSTYQRMWAAMESAEPSVFVDSNPEGVERVVKGERGYAFLMESTLIEYNAERNCNLTQVGGLLDSKGYGIAMPVSTFAKLFFLGVPLSVNDFCFRFTLPHAHQSNGLENAGRRKTAAIQAKVVEREIQNG